MESLLQDLRLAARGLRRSRGFTLVAVLTLALGIGANTAIFSVVDAVLLRPLPYPEPDRLAAVRLEGGASVSKAQYARIREGARSFQDLAAYSGWGFALTGSGEPENLIGAKVSGNLFALLGVRAAEGRTLVEADHQPGRGDVVVLGHALWTRRFGADPGIVGRAVVLNGAPATVVGVMPRGFAFPGEDAADLWMPAVMDPAREGDYRAGYLRLVGRLRPGATPGAAAAEVGRIARELRAEAGRTPESPEPAAVLPLRDEMVGDARRMLLVLLGSVGVVLLIACANVANLLLARASTRRREIAVRTALGAARGRLVRQLLTEAALLAAVGGAAGTLLAVWGVDLLVARLAEDTPRLSEVGIDARVLAFAMGVSLLTGLLFGLAPALRASRADLHGALREGGRGASADPSRQRLRGALVVAETALALLLLAGSGLLLRSLWNLTRVEPGFRAEEVLSLRLSPPSARYDSGEETRAYWDRVLEEVRALPGVVSAGAIHLLPMGESNWNAPLRLASRPLAAGADPPVVDWRVATPDYFRTMGIPLSRGRGFGAADHAEAPRVALVNRTFAERFFPGRDPVGERIGTVFEGEGEWATVVGVVEDVRGHGLAAGVEPEVYRPHAQHPLQGMTLMVRAGADPESLARAVTRAVWSVDRDVPVSEVQAMSAVVAGSIGRPRNLSLLLSSFAGVALLLGVVGIYGVMAYAVAQRAREIGIRMALGARPGEVLRQVLRRGMLLAGAGVLLGLLASAAATRLLADLLHGVPPLDPATFAAASALLLGTALLACWLPARRATRVDPMVTLRSD